MSNIKSIHIRDKLEELGFPADDVILGDFDQIGELTALKRRDPSSQLYKTVGARFRANYERGILAHAIVKKYRPKRILEIGFGRGYWAVCAARAMREAGIDGEIISVDTVFDKAHLDAVGKSFPSDWMQLLKLTQGRSTDVIPKLDGAFDIVYIDGDHTYQGVSGDWNLIKDRFTKLVIFDDYHLPEVETDPNIDVARLVDEIPETFDRELIIMDREIFIDDRRGYDEKKYGQVVLRHPDLVEPMNRYSFDW